MKSAKSTLINSEKVRKKPGIRDGPLEITRDGVKNVWCMNYFKESACLQDFFSRAYDLLFLGITTCSNFF